MIDRDETFDIHLLVKRIKSAALKSDARTSIKSILEASLDNPEHVASTIPDYEENDVILYEDDTVSIWHCRFPVGETVPAHDHQMVATIGVYRGTERNEFWVRSVEGKLEKRTEITVNAGEVLQLGPTAIHSAGCAGTIDCCAIHVYLGNLSNVKRSLFDIITGDVMSFDDDNYERLKTRN